MEKIDFEIIKAITSNNSEAHKFILKDNEKIFLQPSEYSWSDDEGKPSILFLSEKNFNNLRNFSCDFEDMEGHIVDIIEKAKEEDLEDAEINQKIQAELESKGCLFQPFYLGEHSNYAVGSCSVEEADGFLYIKKEKVGDEAKEKESLKKYWTNYLEDYLNGYLYDIHIEEIDENGETQQCYTGWIGVTSDDVSEYLIQNKNVSADIKLDDLYTEQKLLREINESLREENSELKKRIRK